VAALATGVGATALGYAGGRLRAATTPGGGAP
jgi:hypothetical protein